VVNWRGAPAYILARQFTQKIRQLAPLPNTYNLENTTDLITKLKDTPILPQFALAFLDITNLYTNVPVTETRKIIAKALKNNIPNPQTCDELINWYNTITKQNYFSNNGKIIIQKEGLAMGAPTSGLIAEFFLQNLENIHLAHLTEKHKIARYFHYVDDILLIYDPDHTNIQDITNNFNFLHPNLKFTTELETNNKLNYLDITIHRTPTGWKISIYRVPTFTVSHLLQGRL